jgi:hypothetical protein
MYQSNACKKAEDPAVITPASDVSGRHEHARLKTVLSRMLVCTLYLSVRIAYQHTIIRVLHRINMPSGPSSSDLLPLFSHINAT